MLSCNDDVVVFCRCLGAFVDLFDVKLPVHIALWDVTACFRIYIPGIPEQLFCIGRSLRERKVKMF